MKTPHLDKDIANKVYDLLVSIGGALEKERRDFIYHHCEDEYGCSEWRFQGNLGFGGKYKSQTNHVSNYPENETNFTKAVKELLQAELKKLKESYEAD